MALVLADRVRETTLVTGTGPATLLGAVQGYQSFSVVGNGNTTYYAIADQGGPNWEVGIGTWNTGNTLTRTTILASSNGGSATPFTSGLKDVFVTYPSEKSVNLDGSGNVSALGTIASGTWQASTIAIAYGGTNSTTTPTAGAVAYGTGTAYSFTAAGTSNQVLISNGASAPTWSNLSSIGVSSFSGGTTGLLPNTATTGAVTLSGTLDVDNGGTGTSTTFTTGSIVFAGASGIYTQDNANLFWDDTNNRLGVGTATPAVTAALVGTDALLVPKGTTLQQPTGVTGYIRYNTTTNSFEGYSGSPGAWNPVGGATISNDTSTASYEYPLFASVTTGSATTLYTSDAKYLYKPSTGDLQASQVAASNGFILNNATIATSYSITAGYNASSVGPVTISGGVVVTIPASSRWVVI